MNDIVKYNYEVVTTRTTKTVWTLAATSQEEAERLAKEAVQYNCSMASDWDNALSGCARSKVKQLGIYEPTFVATEKGYFLQLDNFTIDYDKARATFCRTFDDLCTVLRITRGYQREDVEGGCYTLRKLNPYRYMMIDDRGMEEVFEHGDIERYIREFEI